MYRLNNTTITALNTDSNSSNFEINYSQTFLEQNSTRLNESIVVEYPSSSRVAIPINVLTNNSSLEAIVVYLKDVLEFSLVKISKLVNRDQRTIWVTYSRAKKKKISISDDLDFSSSELGKSNSFTDLNDISIPLNIFTSRKYSVLESIVLFLKNEYALSFNEISSVLGKNYRTIWTIYRRAILKVETKL